MHTAFNSCSLTLYITHITSGNVMVSDSLSFSSRISGSMLVLATKKQNEKISTLHELRS